MYQDDRLQIRNFCKLGFGTLVLVIYDYKKTNIKQAKKYIKHAIRTIYTGIKVKNQQNTCF